VSIELDESRDPSPMNAGQRMARIAIGAALENLVRTAERNGWQASLVDPAGPALVSVRLTCGNSIETPIEPAVTDRVTNRRLYNARPVPEDVLRTLRQLTPELNGVNTCWIADRERALKLAAMIGRADATMFGEPAMRKAFLANVRFDAPANFEVEQGLSLASLELTAMDRIALRTLRRLPDAIVKVAGIMKVFATKARALVESSSGLCLIVAPDGAAQTDVIVGRATQRAWLALTEQHLAAQPMMSLCVLENVLDHGTVENVMSLGRDRASAVCQEFRALAPELAGGRAGFLMRFGFAPPPSGRTGRLRPESLSRTLNDERVQAESKR
jgi:hypothetical protein